MVAPMAAGTCPALMGHVASRFPVSADGSLGRQDSASRLLLTSTKGVSMKVQLTRRMAGKALATCLASSALSVFLALAGCGGNEAQTVSGLVSADAPVSSVSLKDSSVPPKARTSATDADGAFSFDVNGLTPPFMLTAVDAAGNDLSALAVSAGRTNIDALTTAASFVSGEGLEMGDDARSSSYTSLLKK